MQFKENNDLSQLDQVQSEEIEKIIPIKAQIDAKIIREDTQMSSEKFDSARVEDRVFNTQNANIQNNHKKRVAVNDPPEYDRDTMMKEVNDIIGELQDMLKSKIVKIESEQKLVKHCGVVYKHVESPYFNWAKNLSQNEFYNDQISAYPSKDNLNYSQSDISLTNLDDTQDQKWQFEDPKCFDSPSNQVTGVLMDKLNIDDIDLFSSRKIPN